jgi:spermidine synthase
VQFIHATDHALNPTSYYGRATGITAALADVEIVLGDARLVIAREQKQAGSQGFDFLILDAFTSDAIPVHLWTVEAFRLYEKSLAEDGVLAVHVSNRHFDLIPLVARLGFEVGLDPLVISTSAAARYQSQLPARMSASSGPMFSAMRLS